MKGEMVETLMSAINASWWWLGPLLCGCFGAALVLLVLEVFDERGNP